MREIKTGPPWGPGRPEAWNLVSFYAAWDPYLLYLQDNVRKMSKNSQLGLLQEILLLWTKFNDINTKAI